MKIENFLAFLKRVKISGEGWSAQCPAHDDRTNSLSVSEGDSSKILIKCHSGCTPKDIVDSLGLEIKDLFPEKRRYKNSGLTVSELALNKGFSEEFLEKLGVEQRGNSLRISYYLEDQSLASRQRKRWKLSAKEGSTWEKGEGKPVPYGLWKLYEAQKEEILFFVEGESDCWTLWWHKFSALGFPGADMAKKLEARYLKNIEKIYIIQEPDQGGTTFVKGLKKRLREIRYRGILFVIEMDKHKDPNQLHQKSRNFKEDFTKLIAKAKPLSLGTSKNIIDYGSLIPTLPEPKDKFVSELMQKAVTTGKNFMIVAPQGAGKSYANSYIAVEELKKGRSVIISSRAHDELNQLGKTIKSLLKESGLDESFLFHLKGNMERGDGEYFPNTIPDTRPIIVVAPHIYFQFKGETPYHHTLVEMLFHNELGKNPLLLIDEVVSFLEMSFISKALGSRETLKHVFGEQLWVKNKLCPLYTKSNNCLSCKGSMFLVPRRTFGGMLEYKPISQHHEEDRIKKEKIDYKNTIQWHQSTDDNTMRVYPLVPTKSFDERKWSRGGKKDEQIPISLQYWFEDVISRIIEPHLVYFYPYDLENDEIIPRPLNQKELTKRKKKERKLIPPRNVCGVPIVQGWDLSILEKLTQHAQIGLTGPSSSEADRYVLKKALGDLQYHVAKAPYVQFKNLLIVVIEEDLPTNKKENQELLKNLTEATKVLWFLPTYYEAQKAEESVSEKIRTMYYDGAQKIRNAPVEGTSIEFDLCISCIHGPLAQGLDLGQFKIATVSTNCERPKCLFAAHPQTKSVKDYIIDDVAEKARQAALRILRLTPDESPDNIRPRVVLFYGRYAYETAIKVESELSKVGHVAKVINAKKCTRYVQEFVTKWIQSEDISSLEYFGVEGYEQEVLEKAKSTITAYIAKKTNPTWRDILRNVRSLQELSPEQKEKIQNWFKEHTAHLKAKKQQAKTKTSLEKMINKIRKFLEDNPQATWAEIRRTFHLDRKTKEERELVAKDIGM